jgi:hypothetical protein
MIILKVPPYWGVVGAVVGWTVGEGVTCVVAGGAVVVVVGAIEVVVGAIEVVGGALVVGEAGEPQASRRRVQPKRTTIRILSLCMGNLL